MDPFVGEIRAFAGDFAPAGWNYCDGSVLSVTTYPALYALIGTTYGGNGSTNFALPDLRVKVPVGTGTISAAGGTGTYNLASQGGASQVALDAATMPSHAHTLQALNAVATTGNPTNALLAQTNGNNSTLTPPYADVTLYTALPLAGGPSVPNGALATSSCQMSTGTGQPHNNQMPYLSINFIIATEGIFPTPS